MARAVEASGTRSAGAAVPAAAVRAAGAARAIAEGGFGNAGARGAHFPGGTVARLAGHLARIATVRLGSPARCALG